MPIRVRTAADVTLCALWFVSTDATADLVGYRFSAIVTDADAGLPFSDGTLSSSTRTSKSVSRRFLSTGQSSGLTTTTQRVNSGSVAIPSVWSTFQSPIYSALTSTTPISRL